MQSYNGRIYEEEYGGKTVMIYSGHQLSFFPWMGYWKKIYDSDFFDVNIYDQFTQRTWIHYTYIGNKQKLVKWKLPVEKYYTEHSNFYSIKEVKVTKGFATTMLKQFYDVHHRDKYFDYIYPLLNDWLRSVENLESLWLINLILMEKIYNLLQIETKLVILPNFHEADNSSEKIVSQVESMKCETYLSGPHGREYLDISVFEKKGINVQFQDTKSLYDLYPQSILSLISEFGIVRVSGILRNEEF